MIVSMNSMMSFGRFVPNGYTALKYITVDAAKTQYVDTGIAISGDALVKIAFTVGASTSHRCIFGGRKAYANNSYLIWSGMSSNPIKGRFDYDAIGAASTIISSKITGDGLVHTYIKDRNYNYESEEDYAAGKPNSANPAVTVSSPNTCYVLAANDGGTAKFFHSGQFHYLKIYDHKDGGNKSLLRYLVPVVRNSDSGIFLYDRVSGSFFGNAGTQTPLDVEAGPTV